MDCASRSKQPSLHCMLSADPSLRHGRGGTWGHHKCGTCFSRLPAVKCPNQATILLLKPLRPQHSVFKGCSSVPFARLQNSTSVSTSHSGHSLPCAKPLQTLRSSSDPHSRHSILFLKGVQACRLPGFKTPKTSPRATRATACRLIDC